MNLTAIKADGDHSIWLILNALSDSSEQYRHRLYSGFQLDQHINSKTLSHVHKFCIEICLKGMSINIFPENYICTSTIFYGDGNKRYLFHVCTLKLGLWNYAKKIVVFGYYSTSFHCILGSKLWKVNHHLRNENNVS